MSGFQPRRGQREILQYAGGRMGVSAVPGSGKTATMAALAARLLAERGSPGSVLPDSGRILVVTYQNAAVEALRNRIHQELMARQVSPSGFDVRTLHSLSFSIVQTYPGHAGASSDFHVLDDRAAADLLDKAVRQWNDRHESVWRGLAPNRQGPGRWEEEWTRIARRIAAAVIGAAKNLRVAPGPLQEASGSRSGCREEEGECFLGIGAQVYALYQEQVETVGGLDFDDMVRLAVDLLEGHPDLTGRLAERWPVVLEDEAQDSVPLQEDLLGLLAGQGGNWIRVGDPNQSITSTFTTADPRYLCQFLERPEVATVEMTISGRCSPRIADLANGLVDWACTRHPVTEVRGHAFRRQYIELTEAGDPQQNPPAGESSVAIREYASQEEEFADVARRAAHFASRFADRTLTILVPTNRLGYTMADVLRGLGVGFDERLQSSQATRSVAAALGGILAFAGEPLRRDALQRAYGGVREFTEEPAPAADAGAGPGPGRQGDETVLRLLRSCYRPEVFLYPEHGQSPEEAFPPVREVSDTEMERILALAPGLRRWLEAAVLPIEEMVMTASQDLFAEEDLARAQLVAAFLRGRAESNPHWRLPELAAELCQAAGARELRVRDAAAFEPVPGRISLTTMHRAKGLEWDLVYLVGADGSWFPNSLEERFQGDYDFLGGNPAAMARAAVLEWAGSSPAAAASMATREAHVDTICERLRLLYVAVTRARRFLSVSWSGEVPAGARTRRVPSALAVEALRARNEERWGRER